MEFIKILNRRRACHNFLKGKKIPDGDYEEMIRRTSLTPSGYNAQPWEFVVVRDEKNIQAVQEIAFGQEHIGDCSGLVVVLADLEIGRNVEAILADWLEYGYCNEEEVQAYRNSIAKKRSPEKRKMMAIRNAMLAAMTLIYVAEDMGYATCPIMGFSPWQMEEFLELPEDRVVALLVAVGYRDEGKEKERLPRKSVEEMLHWEKFDQTS